VARGLASLLVVAAVAGCAEEPARPSGVSRPGTTHAARTPPPPSPAPGDRHATAPDGGRRDVCARARALQASIEDLLALESAELDAVALFQVPELVGRVQADVRALRGTARAEWDAQVAALSADLARLRQAIDQVRDAQELPEAWRSVEIAGERAVSSARALRSRLRAVCAPGTSSPGGR
jgi:hypothetical protein